MKPTNTQSLKCLGEMEGRCWFAGWCQARRRSSSRPAISGGRQVPQHRRQLFDARGGGFKLAPGWIGRPVRFTGIAVGHVPVRPALCLGGQMRDIGKMRDDHIRQRNKVMSLPNPDVRLDVKAFQHFLRCLLTKVRGHPVHWWFRFATSPHHAEVVPGKFEPLLDHPPVRVRVRFAHKRRCRPGQQPATMSPEYAIGFGRYAPAPGSRRQVHGKFAGTRAQLLS